MKIAMKVADFWWTRVSFAFDPCGQGKIAVSLIK